MNIDEKILVSKINQFGSHTSIGDYGRRQLILLAVLFVLYLIFGVGRSAALSALAFLSLYVILTVGWRPGEPPTLLFIFLWQWLEASVGTFYLNFQDISIDSSGETGRQMATVLTHLALLAQLAGVRAGIGSSSVRDQNMISLQIHGIASNSWFRLYLAGLILGILATWLASEIPGLSQPLLALASLRWVGYILFTIASFSRPNESKTLWALVFLAELLSSLGGYFSSFKYVFIFTFLAIAAAGIKFSPRMKVGMVSMFFLAILFGTVWSSIKADYRSFVSGGEQAQIVTVEYGDRVSKIVELTSEMTWADLANGFDVLVKRIEYIEYFADVTAYVPEFVPFTDGALWQSAITRPFMPRIFFPDKEVIDESATANRFTDRGVAGMEEGTQISIGYIAETYIDFGPYGMMPMLFLLGVFIGWIYRWLAKGEYSKGILGLSSAPVILLLNSSSVGNGLSKVIGGLAVSVLVYWIFNRFVVPRVLPWILEESPAGTARQVTI